MAEAPELEDTAVKAVAAQLNGGIGGLLWATAARNWWSCALFFGFMTLGVFLPDQVRLMQQRDRALKTGLHLDATSPKVSE